MPELSNEERINERYNQTLEAQRAQMQAAYDQSAAEYQAQMDKAPEAYNAVKKQAHVNNAMSDRARRESMANMGLSAAGGTSQTMAQRGRSTLLSSLGEADAPAAGLYGQHQYGADGSWHAV